MGLLIFVLTIYLLPEGITLLISYNSDVVFLKKTYKKIMLAMWLIVSCIMNVITFLGIYYLIFHKWNIHDTGCYIRQHNFTYQSISYFICLLIICTAASIVWGIVLNCLMHKIVRYKCYDPYLRMRKKLGLFLLLSAISIVIIMSYWLKNIGNQKIVINEICSVNGNVFVDEEGTVCDYIEIYNRGGLPYQISQIYLSDDINEMKKYELPTGIIGPGEYMLIQMDKSVTFSVSGQGESIVLSDRYGNIMDQVECTALTVDTCYCRISDGVGSFEVRTCTPGESNVDSCPIIPSPIFSYDSGFYADEFDLTMSSKEEMDIYYTLDGSVPTKDSIPYKGPIHISDASNNANVWCMREDVSAGFLTDIISGTEYEDEIPGYSAPRDLIDKCTIVRAVCVDEIGNISSETFSTYFVDYDNKEGYQGMNILSVITDPDNLFGYENGIYVRGKVYDDYISENGRDDSFWGWWKANYTQRGRSWEREANLQFFDEKGNLILSKAAGIRIQGGAHRGRVPRSLNLYARKEYDGKNQFDVDFFGEGYKPQKITLFAGGDDYRAKVKDYLMNKVIADRNFSTMNFQPYVLFLDGEYWGCYWLTEKYDEKYFEEHYHVNGNNVVMIKGQSLELGERSDFVLYEEMRSFIIETDLSIEENYRKACEIVDMDSLVDYYAAEIYVGNNDWPNNNCALWRTREKESNSYADGKWRWCLYDVNNAMSSYFIQNDTLMNTIDKDPFLASLMKNEEFQRQFKTTILDMAVSDFLPSKIDRILTDYDNLMCQPLLKEEMRFYVVKEGTRPTYQWRIDSIRDFFEGRYTYILDYYENVFPDNLVVEDFE